MVWHVSAIWGLESTVCERTVSGALSGLLTAANFAGINQAAQEVLDKSSTLDASRGVEKAETWLG